MLDVNNKKLTTMHSYYLHVPDNFQRIYLDNIIKEIKRIVSKHPTKNDELMHFEL